MLVENELNELTKKLLSTKGCSFFLGGIYFASADELQNMFVYQPTFSTIKYHNTRIEYTISWRSKVLYIIDLIPINNDLLSNIKYFNKKVALQFDYTLLVVHQNNCTTKIVNAYIVYDLDSLPKNSLWNFTLKNCLFGETVYSGYGTAFDGKMSRVLVIKKCYNIWGW